MRLKVETSEKLAHRFRPDASFEAKDKQNGHDQTDEPVRLLAFPTTTTRGVGLGVPPLGCGDAHYFGKPCVMSQLSNALSGQQLCE